LLTLDGEGELVDFFDLLDVSSLDESSELGYGFPFFFNRSSYNID
jgi:hypothetical protein